jgi:O-antigen/teichoic acid export membrane protein
MSSSATNHIGERSLRATLKGSVTYSLTVAIQGVLQFLLLPLYTRAMSPAEYGQLGVALSIALFGNLLFSFGLELAIVRAFYKYLPNPQKQESALATIGLFLLVAPLCAAILLSLLAVPLLGGVLIPGRYIALALLDSAVFASATAMPQALLRAQDRLRDFIIVNSVLTVSTVVLTVLFVLGLHSGPTGWLVAVLIADSLTLVVAIPVLPWPRPRNLSPRYLFEALKIGLPLLPHLLSQWALQLSDRVILVSLVAESFVGTYTLAINLASPVLIIVAAISQAVQPSYGRAIHSDNARARLTTLATYQVVATVFLSGAVALLGPIVVSEAIPSGYSEAGALIPFLALGYGIWGLYVIPMNALSFLAGRTTWVWVVTISAAALKLGLMYIFVPQYGLIFAAITLPISNCVLVAGLSALCYFTPGARMNYDWSRILLIIVAGGLVVAPSAIFLSYTTTLGSAVRICIVAMLPILLLASALTSTERARVRTTLQRLRPLRL